MTFKYCFLTTGVGNHYEKLISFELALRNAGKGPQGIAPYNWIFVNSILPARCELVSKEEGLELLASRQEFGDPAYMVLSKTQTKNFNEVVYASIGASRYTQREEEFGYLAEFSDTSDDRVVIDAEDFVRDKVTSYSRFMLHTLVGGVNVCWDSRFRDFAEVESELITTTKSVVASNWLKDRREILTEWATAIACAVLIPA